MKERELQRTGEGRLVVVIPERSLNVDKIR